MKTCSKCKKTLPLDLFYKSKDRGHRSCCKSCDDKLDKIKIPREQDKRVKITEKDKEEIKDMKAKGYSIHEIARAFQAVCSRRMIQFIIYPERRIQAMKNRDWKKYHDRQRLTELVRDIRKRKRDIKNQNQEI
jgi:hypothetical protein